MLVNNSLLNGFEYELSKIVASQLTPYQVVDSLPYKRGYMNGFYKIGVTEEIKKEKNFYKLTVKLNRNSDKERAENMLLLHAAKLTKLSGSDSFVANKLKKSVWCSYRSNSDSPSYVRYVSDTGPLARAYITIVQPNTPEKMLKAKQIRSADKIIEQNEASVLQTSSETSTKEITKSHEQECWDRLQNRS